MDNDVKKASVSCSSAIAPKAYGVDVIIGPQGLTQLIYDWLIAAARQSRL